MRFDELYLEKYGIYETRTLSLADRPGLVVIYGPNEAGKSTCLAAIVDFLFGIPHNSAQGHVFGYDQMRLTATMRMADGQKLFLRRRKGRGTARTLTNQANQILDESVLSVPLGAMTRERFQALFGLDHTSLRSGGERLLAADGDIGRLIVEAGGGLRALVAAIDTLGADADRLFSSRRSADRAFYRALDAFDAADEDVKAGLLTREAFEQARKQHATAIDGLEQLRQSRRSLTERASRQQRLVRVIPMLKELERSDAALDTYADLPNVRNDFAESVSGTLSIYKTVEKDLVQAEERRTELEAEVSGLVAPVALLETEAMIRDIAERAGHVTKARADRPKRQSELAEGEAKLAAVRRSVGFGGDVPLEERLPSQATIEQVQRLVALGLDLRPKIESLQAQISEDSNTLKRLEERQSARQQKGQDKPFGITVAEFSTLAALKRGLETKRNQVARLEAEIAARLQVIGFLRLDDLHAFDCPTTGDIQAESERRTARESDLLKQTDAVADCTAKLGAAEAEIERLKSGGNVPTVVAIRAARRTRDETWSTIRDVYLDAGANAWTRFPVGSRLEGVASFERTVEEADLLTDRQSIEAQRVAALDLAEKQRTEATAAIAAAAKGMAHAEGQIERVRTSWSKAWGQAAEREADLARLRALVEERSSILERAQGVDALRSDIDQIASEVEPKLGMFSAAERHFGLEGQADLPIANRVQAVTQNITSHDDAYADFRRDAVAIADTAHQLQRKQAALDGLQSALEKWRDEWTAAVHAIGLNKDVSPERGNEVATQWAAAGGVIDGLKITRTRLRRMEEDEAELNGLVAKVAAVVEFSLPEDAVAAARMLHEKWSMANKVAIQRASLTPQFEQQTADRDRKQRAVDAAAATIADLCSEANCEKDMLAALAARSGELVALTARRRQTLDSIMSAGDWHSLDVLQQQWGGRDLDEIAADLRQIEEEAVHLDRSIEDAIALVQECKRNLDRFLGLDGINKAVAERESAASEMHRVVERYIEMTLAKELLSAAIDQIRAEQQDPLVTRAGELFALTTKGAFSTVETDIDDKATPVVVGRRATGERVPITAMSDGTRDQLYLAFRLASIEQYCASTEPLPFIGDDLLVHFDDERSAATLDLLAEFGKTTQVLLFTHHRSVCEAVGDLVRRGAANIVEMD